MDDPRHVPLDQRRFYPIYTGTGNLIRGLWRDVGLL